MSRRIHRRELLLAGTGFAVAAALPAAASPAAGVMVFDPRLPESKVLAARANRAGQPLAPLGGDAMRFWQDRLRGVQGPLSGVTTWSDFLTLSEAAGERFLRVRREVHHRRTGQPLLVSWTLA